MWFNLQGSHWQPTVFTSSGHVYWSRKHPLPVGCTVQTSCSRKSWRSFYLLKQNCNVVEGMWWWLVGRTLGIRLYVLPGTKKEPFARFAVRRTLFHHLISCSMTHDQRMGKSRGLSRAWPCPALIARYQAWSQDRTVFFSPQISRMVLFFVQGSMMRGRDV